MPYNEHDARSEEVTAHAQINHGDIAADGGYVGEAVKQKTPSAETARANRAIIASGEQYLLIVKGRVEAPLLGGATQGELLYIDTTTNVIGSASGAGKQVLGRVSDLPGIRGCATGRMRINLDQKV